MITIDELAFARTLKFWRGVYNLSQEDLAHKLSSSTRHISYLENGRTRPSKEMVKKIANVLALGERDRNHLMIAAGFVRAPETVDFNTPELRWLRKAMVLTMRSFDPHPSFIADRYSNILMVNKSWVALYQRVVGKAYLDKVTNGFDFYFAPGRWRNRFKNWKDTVSVILMGFQQELLLSNEPQAQVVLDRMIQMEDIPEDWRQRAARLEPMPSFRTQIEVDGRFKSFFNVSLTVGAQPYIYEPRLIVNTLYPENDSDQLLDIESDDLTHPLLFY